MRSLPFLILLVMLFAGYKAFQSPHGPNFRIDCKTCHSTKGWELDKEVYSFDHSSTAFPLTGQHTAVNCRECHPTLIFSQAKTGCLDCHKDVHQSTVGPECSRCHTTQSWLVSDITGIHRMSRFPLLGPHRNAGCEQCHKAENPVRFDVLGVNCIDCHRTNFLSTTNPNHIQAGFSEDCAACHLMTSFQWTGAGFNHNFFPLILGHSALKCSDCHTTSNYRDARSDCYSCHQKDYAATTNPNHIASNFPTDCKQCHTLNRGWQPATFDHSIFPLTLGHASVTCISCHVGGNYTSISPDCSSCHLTDYNNTTNPNHKSLNFPLTCNTCHTTNPGWAPATFDHGSFPLTLGHASVACASCHIGGNYTSTSTVCSSCHLTDYNNTTNPAHKTLNFSTTCTDCHTTNPGWTPAAYKQHDSQFFPIYSGRHQGTWTSCSICHPQPSNYGVFTCISCHEHSQGNTDPHHTDVRGYVYSATSCYSCHSTGNAGD
ncbi:MAG: hypothetical protein WCE64_11085 [Bacteroidales bacterium]